MSGPAIFKNLPDAELSAMVAARAKLVRAGRIGKPVGSSQQVILAALSKSGPLSVREVFQTITCSSLDATINTMAGLVARGLLEAKGDKWGLYLKSAGVTALNRLKIALDRSTGDDASILVDALTELAERTEAYLNRTHDAPEVARLKVDNALHQPATEHPPATLNVEAVEDGARVRSPRASAVASTPRRPP